jgi:pentatricopeptide repeat protein
MSNTPAKNSKFRENLVFMDDQTWLWKLVSGEMKTIGLEHVRLKADTPVRHSWDRLKHANRIIIHWEARTRPGGAIIEEILEVQPNFDVGERIVILTTNPTHEDVVYFSELGVRRILRMRNRDKDLVNAARELATHLSAIPVTDKAEQAWRRVLFAIDTLPDQPPPEMLAKIEDSVRKLKTEEFTARYLDALGSIDAFKENDDAAVKQWHAALDKNPNYFRAYNNLIKFYRRRGKRQEALSLMQKMHELNKANVSRLVAMGEVQMEMHDTQKAEFYFNSALDRDSYCSGALNGLAEIRFHQGNLEESRRLLSRSNLAYKTAANLNRTGIELVKTNRYQDALEHYTRAQYVLPLHDKGPMLFYNIALCYFRWGRMAMAKEFVTIALIKEPNYKKARKLLEQITGPAQVDDFEEIA